MVRATEVVTFTYIRIYVRAAIGSCDDEYGSLLNGNRSGGLGSCLVKVPGFFCIQRIMHAQNEAALCKNYVKKKLFDYS